jgi:hypothetical protein
LPCQTSIPSSPLIPSDLMGRKISRRRMLRLSATTTVAVVAGCTVDKVATSGTNVTPRPVAARTRPQSLTASEYNKPGDADWRIKNLGTQSAVEAYADKTDVLPGEPVTLFISSTAKRLRVEAFRIGWYGGAQARRVWVNDEVKAGRQTAADVGSGTNTVSVDWQPSLTVPTTGWPEGAYLLRLTSDHGQRYVPLVVRTADTTGKLLLVHATATWQAYNTWGGYSLYQGPGGPADYDNRALVVSFDRPFDGNGALKFLAYERSVASLVDRMRVPVAYTTSVHVHTDPQMLKRASAIISLGHDEYWTPEMRTHVTKARDNGVNVAFLGANACFRRIRYDSSTAGPNRHVICYKTSYTQDPLYGVDNALVTNDYREPPDPNPECSLTGTLYEAYPTDGTYVVLTPDSWIFKGTGVVKGSSFPHLVGPEYDRANPVVPLPRPFQVVAHSPTVCKDTNTYSDSAYYTMKSGAGVFNAGTMRWTGAVLHSDHVLDKPTSKFVSKATANVLRAFKDGPAAEKYPAVDNLESLHPFVGDPTYVHHNLW